MNPMIVAYQSCNILRRFLQITHIIIELIIFENIDNMLSLLSHSVLCLCVSEHDSKLTVSRISSSHTDILIVSYGGAVKEEK